MLSLVIPLNKDLQVLYDVRSVADCLEELYCVVGQGYVKNRDPCCRLNERRTYQAGIGTSVNNTRPLFHDQPMKREIIWETHTWTPFYLDKKIIL